MVILISLLRGHNIDLFRTMVTPSGQMVQFMKKPIGFGIWWLLEYRLRVSEVRMTDLLGVEQSTSGGHKAGLQPFSFQEENMKHHCDRC